MDSVCKYVNNVQLPSTVTSIPCCHRFYGVVTAVASHIENLQKLMTE